MKLTIKQKAFADEYLISGNATEAAKKAGYSEKTARVIAAENLTKPDIAEYIRERQAKCDNSRIASIQEVMEFYTSIMRDECARVGDRIDASKEIMKRYERSDDGKKDALEKLDEVLGQIGGVI